ncbi:hypothetical protein C461_00322 [Halorubrum aidingense JCM 13560]|uniref:Uncharacterized protein n=1 Tax=Halorubrum aidingense JCM 13560 TaxID=1230454 RepID=M0PKY3_9EURY|nr:hypothetical protein [Halorubrum aidingense]EMA70687.1 hypothetical protein C461_00322 [Halorubrum aidingense JCM 13560]
MTEHQYTDERGAADPTAHAESDRPLDRVVRDDSRLDDPRVDDTYLRVVPSIERGGTVVLVGVTHDHPASQARARRVVAGVAPAVVALELSPLVIPLYRQYASERDGRTGGAYDGGEMAAALAASGDGRVVGIDAPNWAYGRRLVAALRARETDREAAVSAVRNTLSVSRHTVTCAVSAAVRAVTPWAPSVETAAAHDSSVTDPPAAQAADEARQLSRSRALLGALKLPPGQELVDELREASMASRIESLRTEGSVVAVVGHAHLDPIRDRLAGEGSE